MLRLVDTDMNNKALYQAGTNCSSGIVPVQLHGGTTLACCKALHCTQHHARLPLQAELAMTVRHVQLGKLKLSTHTVCIIYVTAVLQLAATCTSRLLGCRVLLAIWMVNLILQQIHMNAAILYQLKTK